MNQKLNLDNPKTFNEKLQWLKLYDRKKVYTTMVDKYEVKKYVADLIGEEYIIPVLGVYNKFDEIDFEKLPNQFVIKCTHDSGGIIIVKDKSKLNIKDARKKINKFLKRNFYKEHREWPYKNVMPRIMIEEYIEESNQRELVDYKIHIFNGKPKITLVCKDRFSERGMTEDFFDNDWHHLDLKRPNHDNSKIEPTVPKNLSKMFNLAEKLSKNTFFVRIDFYNLNGRIFFGEITFFPAAGFNKFVPEEWDYKLGSYLKLPCNERK